MHSPESSTHSQYTDRQELKTKDILTFGTLFYVAWILSDLFNGSWIIVFSFEYLSISLALLIGITVALYVAAYKAHKYLYVNDLKQFENVSDDSAQTRYPLYLLRNPWRIVTYRILLLNGIAFYLTWCNIASCLNVGIVIAFVADLSIYIASNIALSILMVIVCAYIVCDFWFFKEYLIFTYSPFFILFWALGGILTNSGSEDGDLKDATQKIVISLLVLSGIYFLVKVVAGIEYAVRQKKLSQIGADEKNYSLLQEKV